MTRNCAPGSANGLSSERQGNGNRSRHAASRGAIAAKGISDWRGWHKPPPRGGFEAPARGTGRQGSQ
jgi:hypothetical protein